MDRTSTEVLANKRAALAQGDEAVMKQIGQGKDIMSILRTCQSLLILDDMLLLSLESGSDERHVLYR